MPNACKSAKHRSPTHVESATHRCSTHVESARHRCPTHVETTCTDCRQRWNPVSEHYDPIHLPGKYKPSSMMGSSYISSTSLQQQLPHLLTWPRWAAAGQPTMERVQVKPRGSCPRFPHIFARIKISSTLHPSSRRMIKRWTSSTTTTKQRGKRLVKRWRKWVQQRRWTELGLTIIPWPSLAKLGQAWLPKLAVISV